MIKLMLGDCLDKLKEIPDNCVDSIVTDPPYGISVMGKKWDYDVPSQQIWEECLRVLKPGGHLLAFAGTRTQHRMAIRIEDAGFEIRDMIAWVYGSGFPKSMDISKAIEKSGGNIDNVEKWNGWGTSLKPALEPITVARKPLEEKTIIANVLKYGTGAINIEESRVQFSDNETGGRFPANLIHDGSDEVISNFPDSLGAGKSLPNVKITGYGNKSVGTGDSEYIGGERIPFDSGSGSAARFFYCAKTTSKDRNEGLDDFEKKISKSQGDGRSNVLRRCPEHDKSIPSGNTAYSCGCKFQYNDKDIVKPKANIHPTVKPTELMKYLCVLVTPVGGTTLDPFMGSGSTGKAAVLGGFNFIGIEREKEYFDIAEARIKLAESESNKSKTTSIEEFIE